jgi:polyadenylate-binding protein
MQGPPTTTPAPNSLVSASLYVGDLHPDISESELLEQFGVAGPVASIRVLRDAMTRRSLGYAYVNFHNVADAERALDTINYQPIRGKPIRIMWKHRDPAKRKSGVGNIFIKNLAKEIDSRMLNDTFSQFGNILSCKVATDDTGSSRGFGFVQYETKEAADNAIEKVNGNLIMEKNVVVVPFLPRNERLSEGQPKFTNVFVKNLDESVTQEQLQAKFETFGKITSAVIMKTDDGKSKMFGFVNFETPEAARDAVEKLKGTKAFGEKEIFVARAEKASQRAAELRKLYAQRKQEFLAKFSGTNLYVKNLDDEVNDELLRSQFEPFGTITSAKVEMDGAKSKGFGYVCFQSPDDATRAVTDMNGRMVKTKPIYVALHQPRDVRNAFLQNQNMQRQYQAPNMPRYPQQQMGPMIYPGPPGQRGPNNFFMFPAGMGRGFAPRPGMAMGPGPRFPRGGGRGGARPMGQPMGPRQGGPQAKMLSGARNIREPGMVSGQPMPQQATLQLPVVPGAMSKEQLAKMLVEATPEQQKQLLGERLYALIAPSQGQLTGKITGMLLEGLDNGELLHLIDSPQALDAKIQEALAALRQHVEQGH